jgi:LEA14-like dessication related protein
MVVLLLAIVLVANQGCETLQAIAQGAPKPSAAIRSVQLESVSLDGAALAFDVEVTNPYSVPLPLLGLDYTVASGESRLLTGRADPAGSIPAGASKTISVPAVVRFSDVLNAIAGVRPGQVVPYAVNADVSVDAPGLGTVALPLQAAGELPIPAVPEVELTSVQWSRLSLDEATAVLNVRVLNQNTFATDLTKLNYGLSLAGMPIVETSLRQSASFRGGAAQDLAIPIAFRPKDLGLAALRILGGEGGAYRLAGTMSFDTPFGPIELPYERVGETVFAR